MDIKPETSIEVRNKKELKAVLKKLEQMGYLFASGRKPMVVFNECRKTVTAVDVCDNERLRVSHDGFICYKNRISAKDFLGENECIVIYRKDGETIALDKKTGKMANAICCPEDEYDFYTGAKLAFERLTGEQPEKEEKPAFKPYLMYRGTNTNYGYIGESTPLKDVIGRELKVGDTVELYDKNNNFKCEEPIAFNGEKYFVMGIACDCKKDGIITGGFKIIKKRDYKDIKNGEKVDGIEYVLAEG